MARNPAKPAAAAKVEAPAVPVGVYLDAERRTAIVLRSKDGVIVYLSMAAVRRTFVKNPNGGNDMLPVFEVVSQEIDLHSEGAERFLARFTTRLPAYPPVLAVRKYAQFAREGMVMTDRAAEAARRVLLAARA